MQRILKTLVLMLAILGASQAHAQEGIERVPDSAIKEVAPHILASITQNLNGSGIKVDAVPENSLAFRSEGSAVLLMPDRNLTAKSIGNAGEAVTPLGVLLLKRLCPVHQGQIPPLDKLAFLGPTGDASEVVVLFLGVRKDAQGPILEVYSKETKALYQVPFKRREVSAEAAPLLDGRFTNLDKSAQQGDFVTTFGGIYEVALRIGAAK